MRYTAKDVCKLHHITRDALRYYEKMGVIHPEIDPENQYRYYDDWDINFIGECKKYQSLGLSVKEIAGIYSGETKLETFIGLIADKRQESEKKYDYYRLLNQYHAGYYERLSRIREQLNRYTIIQCEQRYFTPYRKGFEYDMTEDYLNLFHKVMDQYAFFDITVYIPWQDYAQRNEQFYWGHSLTESYRAVLDFDTAGMIELPRRRYLYTVIDAGERWGFGHGLFDDALAYMERHRYKADGDIYGNLLTRVYDENHKFCRYIEVFIPITED